MKASLSARSAALLAVGLLLVGWALVKTFNDLSRALHWNRGEQEVVLETYAPNTGPLATDQAQKTVRAATPTRSPGPTTQTLAATAQVSPQPGFYLSEEVVIAHPTEESPALPTRIVIPAINLDAPVLSAASKKIRLGSSEYFQWDSPNEFAAGWHTNTAYPGQAGNTVLNGHNNIHGAVFGNLFRLKPADKIEIYAGERKFVYLVAQKMVLEEADVPVKQRLENARWLSRSDDVRLTLVTCWPNDTNSHRLIVVAVPE